MSSETTVAAARYRLQEQGLSEPSGRDEHFRLVLLTWDYKTQLLLPAQTGKESLS